MSTTAPWAVSAQASAIAVCSVARALSGTNRFVMCIGPDIKTTPRIILNNGNGLQAGAQVYNGWLLLNKLLHLMPPAAPDTAYYATATTAATALLLQILHTLPLQHDSARYTAVPALMIR